MELKYKLFPYPVLWDVLDDYKSSHFISNISVTQTVKRVKISCSFDIDNEDIDKYLQNDEVEYIAHIECPLTAYRTILCTTQSLIECEIPESELNGKVSICTFILAKKNINTYINNDFNDDYAGISFKVERGAILAVGKQVQIRVDKNMDELANLPSIFSIIKKETTERLGMQVEMNSQKIGISLNINDFSNYQIISKMPDLIPVIHSSLILPALIYILEQLKNGYEDYEDYRWFKSILVIFRKYNIIFDYELLQNKTSLELAQILLDIPTERTFAALAGMNNVEDDEI